MVEGKTQSLDDKLFATKRPTPILPPEVIDMILDLLTYCPKHLWSTPKTPCFNTHTPSRLPSILKLRQVNRTFNLHMTPTIFRDISAQRSAQRHHKLYNLSRSPLTAHIRTLRLELAPVDLGARMRRVTTAVVPAPAKLRNFLETLHIFLVPVLKRFAACRTLHVGVAYDGVDEAMHRRAKMVADMMPVSISALCGSVGAAEMESLEEVVLAVPYDGSYVNHFDDLTGDEARFRRLLKRCGKNVRSGTVKLCDSTGGVATMPFF